jgi:hypothetical protein
MSGLTIISIDVGIKNLAFCILNLKDGVFIIKQWDVINLCEEKPKCIEINSKNSKPCDKDAKYFKNQNYYCNTHAKHKSHLIPPPELSEKCIKKLKVTDLIELANTHNVTYNKLKPTKNNVMDAIQKMMDETYLNPVKTVNAEDYDLVRLGISMRDKLNLMIHPNEIDMLIIENQISPLANRMKTLQGMIAQYFIMNNVINIVFYSASNKLKPFMDNQKTTYQERKKIGVECVKQLLAKYNEINQWESFFMKHSKRDDLADSFLQGLSYFNQYKNLTIEL